MTFLKPLRWWKNHHFLMQNNGKLSLTQPASVLCHPQRQKTCVFPVNFCKTLEKLFKKLITWKNSVEPFLNQGVCPSRIMNLPTVSSD